MTDLTAGEATHVDPASVQVLSHLDFLCRVVLPGEATAGSVSLIEQRARLGWMTPRHVHAREAETPIPGPVSPEKVSELVSVLTPLGARITGPPPFDVS